jgi:hypothetical protein
MPIKKDRAGIFDEVLNTDFKVATQNYKGETIDLDPNKLHICLDPRKFLATNNQIIKILQKALENKVISGYKSINTAEWIEMTGEYDYPPDRKMDSSGIRAREAPYTIYLHAEVSEDNKQKVLAMCLEIEKVLFEIEAHKNLLYHCDRDVSAHLVYRLAVLNGEYIAAIGPKTRELSSQELAQVTELNRAADDVPVFNFLKDEFQKRKESLVEFAMRDVSRLFSKSIVSPVFPMDTLSGSLDKKKDLEHDQGEQKRKKT